MLAELRALELDPNVIDGYAVFDWPVRVGSLTGTTHRIGLLMPVDYPLTPPPAPQVNPPVADPASPSPPLSPLGTGWLYWSRPFPNWASTGRTMSDYLAHLRRLFAEY